MAKISCISDRPITVGADALDNDRYAKALLEFILEADTPITVGIQGGWGSGKTSLINLLQAALDADGKMLCVFVNAWEQSLFAEERKSMVAISLLKGMVEKIKTTSDQRAQKMLAKKVLTEEQCSAYRKDLHDEIGMSDAVERVKNEGWGGLYRNGKGAALTLLRLGVNLYTGINTKDYAGPETGGSSGLPRLDADFISALRQGMQTDIDKIKKHLGCKGVVCFVDDLDRVHPHTAVEILDVIKNVFDVRDCIFVLAIDYDVVVKGLEQKFGAKSLENEREFRQYFDKIIQVPFSMPVGAYQEKTAHLLAGFLSSLGQANPILDIKEMADVAWRATDGAPRSVKRIVNTLSLLQKVTAKGERPPESSEQAAARLEILFIVIALQINFPEIHRRLAESSDFAAWAPEKLKARWSLDVDKLTDNIAREDDFDEEWEQVVYLLCMHQPWLRSKARDISKILNRLKDILAVGSTEPRNGLLIDALNASKVTDVSERPSADIGEGTKADNVTRFLQAVHKRAVSELQSRIHVVPLTNGDHWARDRGGRRAYGPKGENGIAVENSPTISFLVLFFYERKGELHVGVRLHEAARAAVKEAIEKRRIAIEVGDMKGEPYLFVTAKVTVEMLDKPKDFESAVAKVVRQFDELIVQIDECSG